MVTGLENAVNLEMQKIRAHPFPAYVGGRGPEEEVRVLCCTGCAGCAPVVPGVLDRYSGYAGNVSCSDCAGCGGCMLVLPSIVSLPVGCSAYGLLC